MDNLQRLILANQYRIMSMLEPDEGSHRLAIHAIEHGFESEIEGLADDTCVSWLSKDSCHFVLDVLEMFNVIDIAIEEFEPDAAERIKQDPNIKFRGFDGNHETGMMKFAEFQVVEKGHWESLNLARKDMNSHLQMKDKYSKMLAVYRPLMDGRNDCYLTADEVRKIASA